MLNAVVLAGRVGADPEIKYFESNKIKTSFSLAVSRPVKRGEGVEDTDWFRIELWGRKAEVANEYLRKGSLIGVSGRLEYSRWTDANGGRREMPIIAANDFYFLGSKGDNQAPRGTGGDGY